MIATAPRILTDKQRAIFEYIFTHVMRHGFQPSYQEIADQFHSSSRTSTTCHLRAIERKGWIRLSGRSRHALSRAVRFLYTPLGDPFVGFSLSAAQSTTNEERSVESTPSEA